MSTQQYTEVVKGEDGKDDQITILTNGFINSTNIKERKFMFSAAKDITENLAKKSSSTSDSVSVTKKGRTAYRSMICEYPDGSQSSKMTVENCVVQWREVVNKDSGDYAKTYVAIGIDAMVINKIKSDAKKNSSMDINVKSSVTVQEGCYWFSCSLERLSQQDIWIIYTNSEGQTIGGHDTIHNMLRNMEKSIECTITFTCSGSMSSDLMQEKLDLKNGTYYFTLKPTELYMNSISKKTGPVLEDANKRGKESAEQSERLFASSELAEYAMRNLRI